MKTDKWLYFRSVTDVDDDDGCPASDFDVATSTMVSASRLINMYPLDDNTLRLELKPVKHAGSWDSLYKRAHAPWNDTVDLTVATNKHKEVMQTITSAINSPSRTSFIVIADDVVTDVDNNTIPAEYIDGRITACATITLNMTPPGYGMHEYFEVVPLAGGTSDDTNDVVGSLQVKLPAQSILLEASMVTMAKAGSNHGLVALEYHSAAIADDAASGGTELLGADATGNKGIPDADLDVSSDAILYDTLHSGTFVPVDRSTAETFFQVTAKENMSSMTGVPIVGVYIRWQGGPAHSLAQQ